MTKLKSCPFCGGEAVPVYSDKGSLYTSNILMLSAKGTVKCKKCEVRLPRIYSRVSKAIEAWNRRAEPWIPITERLPKERMNPNTQDYDWVLCSTTFDDVRAYHFGGGKFLHGGADVTQYITAWMPLPQPYCVQ